MKKSKYFYLIAGLILLFLCGYLLYTSISDSEKEDNSMIKYQSFFNEIDSIIYSTPSKARIILISKKKEIKSPKDKAYLKLSSKIALSYFLESKYQQLLEFIYETIKIYEKNNLDKETAILYDYMASIYLQMGNYHEANNNSLKAQRIYDRINDNDRQAFVLNNMGVLYLKLENTDKAIESFNNAITIACETKNKQNLGIFYANKSSFYLKKNEFDSAQIYADLAIKESLEKTVNNYLPKVYETKGNVYLHQEDFKLARYFLAKSLNLARKNNAKKLKINALISLGKYFFKQQMLDSAIFYSTLAIENIIILDSNYTQLKQVNDLYRKIYKESGNIEKTLFYTEELLNLNNKESEENKAHEIYNRQLKQAVEQKLAADDQIEIQNHLLKNKNVIIFIILLCLLIVLLLYIYRKQKQHSEILLLTKRKNKAAIESEVIERGRIGKELHDGLGQILTVIRLNLSLLSKNMVSANDKENEYLKNSIAGVDDVFAEMSSIIQNLSPTIITNKGLEKAIRKIVTEINNTKKVSLQFEIFGFETRADSLIENVLYRSVQELINNSIKHSNASEINIQLVKGDEEITLMVEDNGIGFDYKKHQTNNIDRHGLNNISTRVKNLNGHFYVDSQLERGSIINIIIPIY